MTLAVGYHPEAEREFRAAIAWYDERQPQLGERFEAAVDAVIDTLVLWPESAPRWPGWDRLPVVRGAKVADFPYRVAYSVTDDELTVIAVAHHRREPGYWRRRLDQ